jgi:hypothetical protein
MRSMIIIIFWIYGDLVLLVFYTVYDKNIGYCIYVLLYYFRLFCNLMVNLHYYLAMHALR